MNALFSLFLPILGAFLLRTEGAPFESTLKEVHVLFRHGDRTPQYDNLYPNDPYLNDTYFPIGRGGLTNLGKEQEYEIGVYLRNTYGEFLGEVYYPEVMEAWSTDVPRTKMSLLAAMAGLWPPSDELIWNEKLLWQPIPFEYRTTKDDKFLTIRISDGDPTYRKLYEEALKTPEVQVHLAENADFFKYVNEHSGLNASIPYDLFKLFFGLNAEHQLNKTLPQWTEKIFPDGLESWALYEYKVQTLNRYMMKYSIGRLIGKMINDSEAATQNKETPKIHLYSAHEMQVAQFLRALKVEFANVPPYASFIVVEMHHISNGENLLKFYYQDYREDEPKLLDVPGCAKCTVEQFKSIMLDILPDEN